MMMSHIQRPRGSISASVHSSPDSRRRRRFENRLSESSIALRFITQALWLMDECSRPLSRVKFPKVGIACLLFSSACALSIPLGNGHVASCQPRGMRCSTCIPGGSSGFPAIVVIRLFSTAASTNRCAYAHSRGRWGPSRGADRAAAPASLPACAAAAAPTSAPAGLSAGARGGGAPARVSTSLSHVCLSGYARTAPPSTTPLPLLRGSQTPPSVGTGLVGDGVPMFSVKGQRH